MISILIVAAALLPAAAEEETGKGREADPVLAGTVTFGKAEAGEMYRKGLGEFREKRYAEAAATFRKGRSAAAGKTETAAFDRLIREARGGEDLEKIRKTGTAKGGELKALAELRKAAPKVKDLSIAGEYRRLEDELRELVYFVIDDFEPEGDEGTAAASGDGKEGEKAAEEDGGAGNQGKKAGGSKGRTRGGRNPFDSGTFGPAGKTWKAALEGGEIQLASRGPDKVFQGKGSFRWPIGKDLRVKALEFEPGTLKGYRSLVFAIRGSEGKNAPISIFFVHKDTDPVAFALGKYRGYTASVTVSGPAWKEHRMVIGKDLTPRDEPENDRIGMLVFLVKNQPDQVIYLDDVRLER